MYILFLPEATCLTQCKMYRCQHNGACRGMKHVNDTVLLKQKKRSVLDIAGLFFSMSTRLCTKAKKKRISYIQYGLLYFTEFLILWINW